MALDHHGRAWVAAIAAGRLDEAHERVAQGRAGVWSATSRDGLNALMIAARHGPATLVEALARAGARALHPGADALLDWLDRGDRTALNAYEQGVPTGEEPYPGLLDRLDPSSGEPLRTHAIGEALRHGWTDLANRWWPQDPSATGPGWDAMLVRAVQNAVWHDRPEQLAGLHARASLDWPSLRHPGTGLEAHQEGNLLVLAAEAGSVRVLPWLLDHGVAIDGRPSPSPTAFGDAPKAKAQTPVRPWLHALTLDSQRRPSGQPWDGSRAAVWLDAWLDDPRTHAALPLKSTRFGPDLLQELIRRQDLSRVDRVLALHDFHPSGREEQAVPIRLPEHTAMAQGDPAILDRVLRRTQTWNPKDRHEALAAAFERWTRDALSSGTTAPGDLQTPPGSLPLSGDQRRDLLNVLVTHGWDLNGPAAQTHWATVRTAFAEETVLTPARAAGWSPAASAAAWPDGAQAYALLVMGTLFTRGTVHGKTVMLPGKAQAYWGSRWFGNQGWLRATVTPDWWLRAWDSGTSPTPSTDRFDWLLAHLPDGIVDPAHACQGLRRWSQFHLSSSQEKNERADQLSTLDRWIQRFGSPGVTGPAAEAEVATMMQQIVWDHREDWFDRWHRAFPTAVQTVRPATHSRASMIRTLASLGVNVNPAHPHRGPLLDDWLNERRQKLPSGTVNDRTLRTFHEATNPTGLCELLRQLGGDPPVLARSPDQAPDEPLIVYAARTQDWALVDLLRRAGANVNAADARGCTALSWAVALHDRPSSRDWQGLWPLDENDPNGGQESYRLHHVAQALLEAGASLRAAVPGKDRTLARAFANPRHQRWITSDPVFFMAVERAQMLDALATSPAPDAAPVPSPVRRRL